MQSLRRLGDWHAALRLSIPSLLPMRFEGRPLLLLTKRTSHSALTIPELAFTLNKRVHPDFLAIEHYFFSCGSQPSWVIIYVDTCMRRERVSSSSPRDIEFFRVAEICYKVRKASTHGIHTFPAILRRGEDLVHYTNMLMLRLSLVPPFHRFCV